MSIEGIEFYKSVCKTNPDYVKRAKVGGRMIATIDPQYQTELATEKWGLYGHSWGVKNTRFENTIVGETIIRTLYGVFFYPLGEFEYAVSGKFSYPTRQGGLMIDEDIEKKLLTKFQSKCLSKLGFNADVYLGMYDDAEYVNEVSREFHKISAQQLGQLMKLINETETKIEAFCNAFSIKAPADLPETEFNKAVAMLNAKLKKANDKVA
ncbi:hypothetical protein [Hydrogenimonas sp.]